jgi:hypothetical protein
MTIFRPIDSFKEYFLDVKPYHTKILEIVEQYNFQEDLLVNFDERLFVNVDYANNPVCKPVGYGLVWDDECGFDAVDCCDLFDCIGGFGLVYDNSDMVAEYEILDINVETDSIIVSGNRTRDVRIQIGTIPAENVITVVGDVTSEIGDKKLFIITPIRTLKIKSNTSSTIDLDGNVTNYLVPNKEFQVYNTESSDGIYRVGTVSYSQQNNVTTIELLSPDILNETIVDGFMEFRINSRNSGVYLIDAYVFDGVVTSIFLEDSTPLNFTNSTEGDNHGSIQLKTGLIPGREIHVEGTNTANDRAYDILKSAYDKVLDQTEVFVSGDLFLAGVLPTPTPTASLTPSPSVNSSPTPTPTSGISPTPTISNTPTLTPTPSVSGTFLPSDPYIRMYGYLQDSGFDGGPECSAPKHSHAKVGMSELLQIKIEGPGPTPTPSPLPAIYRVVMTESDAPISPGLRTFEFDLSTWTEIGNESESLGVNFGSRPTLAALGNARVVHSGTSASTNISTFDFDGTDFSRPFTSTDTTYFNSDFPSITTLSPTSIAHMDTGSPNNLRKMDLVGGVWVDDVVTNIDPDVTLGNSVIAAMTSERVALVDNFRKELRAYDLKDEWVLTGVPLSIGVSGGGIAVCALNSSTVVVADSAGGDESKGALTVYEFNGNSWSQVGNTRNQSHFFPALDTLAENLIVFFDSETDSFRALRWDGTDLTQIGAVGSVGKDTVVPAIAAIDYIPPTPTPTPSVTPTIAPSSGGVDPAWAQLTHGWVITDETRVAVTNRFGDPNVPAYNDQLQGAQLISLDSTNAISSGSIAVEGNTSYKEDQADFAFWLESDEISSWDSSGTFGPPNDYTVMGWVRIEDANFTNDIAIMSQGPGTGTGIQWWIGKFANETQIVCRTYLDSNSSNISNFESTDTGIDLVVGDWVHYAVTWTNGAGTGGNGLLKYYMDGVNIATHDVDLTDRYNVLTGGYRLIFGNQNGFFDAMDGDVYTDAVRIWGNNALTDDQIELHATLSGGKVVESLIDELANPLENIQTDLISWWSLEEDLDNNRVDATAGGRDMTVVNRGGDITAVSGLVGNAASFVDEGDYLTVDTDTQLQFHNNTWTLAFWGYFPSTIGDCTVFAVGDVEVDYNVILQVTNSGATGTFEIWTTTKDADITFSIPQNIWTFLTFEVDTGPTNPVVRVYVNNTLVGEDTVNSPGNWSEYPEFWLGFGGFASGFENAEDFDLDEVAFWRRKLLYYEREELYNNGNGYSYGTLP